MNKISLSVLSFFVATTWTARAVAITADLSSIKPGPIGVVASATSITVDWDDGIAQHWQAVFSLDSTKPLVTAVTADGNLIVDRANPVFRLSAGKRKGGWDAFFDIPPDDPAGTRRFAQQFHPVAAHARTVGNRVEVDFDGMTLGPFSGVLRYSFYPGTSLIQQSAILHTSEADTAYIYDEGFQMAAPQDLRPGGNMASTINFFDPLGASQTITSPYGSERHTMTVRYRTLATTAGSGSIAVFPSPHRYLFARDYTTNLGFNWYSAWRGQLALGIQLPPDDNTLIYPWINAPPGTAQEMGMFILLGGSQPAQTLTRALEFTHADHFPHLPGFVTLAPHWHFALTDQVSAHEAGWVPPFKSTLEAIGVDAIMPMDFHGDGHPYDLTRLRLRELTAYRSISRALSDNRFLVIPAEEGNTILGGHWAIAFPHDVLFFFDRKPGEPLKSQDSIFGPVYHVKTQDDVLAMVKAEDGLLYTTHPRTKGSTGFPDGYFASAFFRDPVFLGAGWKAMPSDLSSPRLGERAFKTLDDMNNLGFHKLTVGEVDVFQLAPGDELYSQVNVNYLPLKRLPDYEHRGLVLNAVSEGNGFISTGEILLPHVNVQAVPTGVEIDADVTSTFPLRLAEIVWGQGGSTHRKIVDLSSNPAFETRTFHWHADAPGWAWVRVAVWDIAGDGAFTNPTWNETR
jgi:hypothetical protein